MADRSVTSTCTVRSGVAFCVNAVVMPLARRSLMVSAGPRSTCRLSRGVFTVYVIRRSAPPTRVSKTSVFPGTSTVGSRMQVADEDDELPLRHFLEERDDDCGALAVALGQGGVRGHAISITLLLEK